MGKKIELFESAANKHEVLSYNGIVLDEYCTYCQISESLTENDFSVELDLRFPGSLPSQKVEESKVENNFSEIVTVVTEEEDIIGKIKSILLNGSILKVKDEYDDYEIFRITNININTNNSTTTVYGRQITLEDSLRLWINSSKPTNMTGASALEKLYTDSEGRIKELTTYSNINTTDTVFIVRKNLNEAIFGNDVSFLERWGGEVERRGYNLSILKERGSDKGVVFRRGKNYTGIEEDVNQDKLVTRIIPIAFDGITLPEIYIDSPKINNYYNVFPQEIKFEEVKYKDSPNNSNKEGFDTLEEVYAELRKQASEYFTNNKCDELRGVYNIKVVDVSSTEEYKELSIFEKTWIGDTVTIIDEKLNLNIKARVTKRKFDVIKGMRSETEVTNITSRRSSLSLESLQNQINNIQTPEVPDIDLIIQQAKEEVEEIIRNGITDSYVVLKENEILIMDTNNVDTAVKVLRMNKHGIAGSTTGYNGSFNLAMTIDGQIVADRITTGILNASLIKAGTLMSANGKSWLNMQNGTFNFSDKIKFDGNSFELYLNSGTSVEDSINSKTKNLISGGNFRARNFEAWTNDKLNNISFYEGINGLTGIKVIDGTKEGWIVSNFIDIKSLQTNKFGLALNMTVESNVNSSQIYIQYYDISKKLLNEILLCDLENNFSGIKKIEDITIPPSVYYIAIRIDHNGLKNTSSNENTVVYIDYINFTKQKSIEGQLEDDGKIDSYFKMTSKELALKVGEDNISTLIEANPKSVQVAFNNINENIQNSQGIFSIKNGKLELYNNNGNKVFWVDTSGRTATDNLNIYGGERLGNIDIKGTGNKGIVIRSLDGGDRYLDFSTFNDDGSNWAEEIKQGNFTRLWAMNGDFYIMPTDKLFISSCNSKFGGSKLDEVVIKAVKTTIEGNLIPDSLNAVKSISTPSLTVNNIYSGSGWLILNSMSNFKNKVYCEDYLLTKKIGHGSTGGVLNENEAVTFYSPIELNNKNINGVGTVSTTNLTTNNAELNYAKINYLNGDINCNNKQLYNLKYINGDNLSGTRVTCNELSGGSYFKILSPADFNRNSINNVYRVSCTELAVSGSKNCVQDTESFGKRLINAYETCDYYFGDIGESQTINGEMIIWIDDIFKEIISTEVDYQVFITKYGRGDIWVEERTQDYFVVKSENDINFGWEIKGKRKGYEKYRLEEFKEDK